LGHLRIDQSRPRGGDVETTKGGRERRGAFSRRLRSVLAALYDDRFRPSPQALVLEGIDSYSFRRRPWRRICQRAEIGQRAMKDLRDTFASQLLTCGVSIGYVSSQLGHTDLQVTTRHYARWCGGEGYREPIAIEQGEIPADLLARIAPEIAHESPTSKCHRSERDADASASDQVRSGIEEEDGDPGAIRGASLEG
jgi:hypothetical protein